MAADDGHRTIRADLFIADRLKAVVQAQGRLVYAPYEREAARLLERGRDEKDARLLDQVCRHIPWPAVPDALVALGALYESSKHWTDAAHVYKRLLFVAPDDELRAQAIWRLAHVYETRKLFLSARDSYLELQARFPHAMLKEPGGSGTVADLVAAELARPPYTQLIADRPLPPTPIPLLRRWYWQAPGGQTLQVSSAWESASLDAGSLFIVEKSGLRLLDPATGLPRWSAELGEPAIWAGYLADRLIAATPRQIVALDLGQGTVQWRYDISPRAETSTGQTHSPTGRRAIPQHGGPGRRGAVWVSAHEGACLLPSRCERPGLARWRLRRGRLVVFGSFGADQSQFSGRCGSNDPPGRSLNQLLVLRTEDGQPTSRHQARRKRIPAGACPRLSMKIRSCSSPIFEPSRNLTSITARPSGCIRRAVCCRSTADPRVFGDSERLLVLHDGHELIRLDPATGSKRWSCSLGSQDLSDRPGAMIYDDKRFYCVNTENIYGGPRQAVRAISLEDGSSVWSRRCRPQGQSGQSGRYDLVGCTYTAVCDYLPDQ